MTIFIVKTHLNEEQIIHGYPIDGAKAQGARGSGSYGWFFYCT